MRFFIEEGGREAIAVVRCCFFIVLGRGSDVVCGRDALLVSSM